MLSIWYSFGSIPLGLARRDWKGDDEKKEDEVSRVVCRSLAQRGGSHQHARLHDLGVAQASFPRFPGLPSA